MEKRILKIFMACAIGAFVGSLVALELNKYFWWLGLLVGGLTGYISYEFKTIPKAMLVAYKRMLGRKLSDEEKAFNKALVNTFLIGVVACCLGAVTFLTLPGLLLSFFLGVKFATSGLIALGCLTFFLAYIVASFTMDVTLDWKCPHCVEINKIQRNKYIKAIKVLNPVSFYFYWIPWGIKRIPRVVVRITVVVFQFLKTLFILIHSDERLLCGVDAMIGTAIGYFSGSAIIGFFAGGIFGAINYEIVSKRLLRLHLKQT